jgi:hypothetical protein
MILTLVLGILLISELLVIIREPMVTGRLVRI